VFYFIAGADAFSGKQSSIDFLIKKSRGKARMMPCSLTAIGVNGRTLNFADFFDKDGAQSSKRYMPVENGKFVSFFL
jgi:hypothetical protein